MSALEFIAAVKWPVTVLILAAFLGYLLRSPGARAGLGAWVGGRDLRVRIGQIEASLAQTVTGMGTAATSDEALAATLQQASAPLDRDLSAYHAPTPEELGMVRREAVETIMRSSAEWGWDMAQRGLRSLPELDVHWNSEGQPDIGMLVYEVGRVGPGDLFRVPQEVRRRRRDAAREYVEGLARHGPTGPPDRDA